MCRERLIQEDADSLPVAECRALAVTIKIKRLSILMQG